MKVKFSIPGEPKGKARPRTVRLKNGMSKTYTPDDTVIYENMIRAEYRRQCGSARFPDGAALDMRVIAYFAIPVSAPKKKQKMMEAGEIRPTKKPDWDNIAKIIGDALNMVAYRDDSHIVDGQIRKFYSTNPRVEVTILAAKEKGEKQNDGIWKIRGLQEETAGDM